MWISQEDENSQGQTGDQPPPPIPQEKALCINFSFPKTARLCKKADYQRLQRVGRKFSGKVVFCNCRIGGNYPPRLGVTVSKKYGKAVRRNYFKRIVRESFRLLSPTLPRGFELNVAPLSKTSLISLKNVAEDIREAIIYAQHPAKKSS